MRRSSDLPPPRAQRRRSRGRWRVIVGIAAAVAILLAISFRSIAGFYTDFLWFDSLGFSSVWRQVVVARVLLTVIFVAAMFVLLWANLYLADRLAPPYRPAGPEEDFVRRYHEVVGHRVGLVRVAVALLFAVAWGATANGQWRSWILFRNRVDFGIEDPQFGRDVGFYVFELPFIQFAVDWLFTAILFTFVITTAAHYLNGGIRLNAGPERVAPQVKVHLSVLLSALVLVQAVDYWYQRFALTLSTRGAVDGATYTDVNAQLPALSLLILISLCAAALLIVNVRRRGWVLPAVAVGLWAFTAVVVGGIYPAVYQRLIVEPSESEREAPFIGRNIEATRAAYNMTADGADADIESIAFPLPGTDLSPELLADNADTIENIRLLDPTIMSQTFERLEAERDEYQFTDDLDVDRYLIDGQRRPVLIGARQLDIDNIPGGKWENQHISFTHGFGVAMAAANEVVQGRPSFVVGGLPTVVDEERLELELEQPRIYIGEELPGYAIVGTDRAEVDFPQGNENIETRYDGADGVRLGGIFRRLAFAFRFGDLNPLVSGLLNDGSRVIYNRDVEERARTLAPFLDFDADPYPVVVDGRIVWVLDAYTTTDRYPYAQQVNLASVPGDSGLRKPLNYVRNSVKVTVDAYDGTVRFYVIDPDDPIVTAYARAFPDLFTDFAEMPLALQSHLRYPEDLFRIQTNMWGRYHIDEPRFFFDPTQAWAPAEDPGRSLNASTSSAAPTPTPIGQTAVTASGRFIDPYYVQMRLPGEDETEFVLVRPFVPAGTGRQELTAFMAARSDPEHYGQLVVYEMPNTTVDGPALADADMQADPVVARQTTLLSQQGSAVQLGNMLLIPVEDNLIWVRPLYVSGGATSVPQLTNVIVSYQDRVRICPRLDLALASLFVEEEDLDDDPTCRGVAGIAAQIPTGEVGQGEAPEGEEPPAEGEEPATPTPTTVPPLDGELPPEALDLLREAQDAFAAADEALADNDLGRYQDLIEEAEAKVAEALALVDPPASPPSIPDPEVPTATPSPTPTPEPDDA